MKYLLLSAAFSLVLMSCSGQQIAQNVSVVVNTTPSAEPSSTPASSDVLVSPTPLPNINNPAPSQPSQTPVPATTASPVVSPPVPETIGTTAITELFKTTIPNPESVKSYMRTEIRAAEEGFKARYEASKTDAIEVMKMVADASLMGTNKDLAKTLAKVLSAEPTPNRFCSGIDGCLANFGLSEVMTTAYGAKFNSRMGTFSFDDLEQRKLSFVRYSGNEILDVHNPYDLIPENPSENEVVTLIIKCVHPLHIQAARTLPEYAEPLSTWETQLVFESEAWKLLPESVWAFNGRLETPKFSSPF